MTSKSILRSDSFVLRADALTFQGSMIRKVAMHIAMVSTEEPW